MVAKTITYKDFEGTERTETFWFHLSKTELVKMENSIDGGYKKRIQAIIDSINVPELMKIFDELLQMSYGVKSADGRRFIKNKELTDEFMQTPAYDIFYMELYTDANVASEFINKLMPADLIAEIEASKNSDSTAPALSVVQ